MLGQMQHWPLTNQSVLDHAARHHPRRRIIGRLGDGGLGETDWATLAAGARGAASALRACGVAPGDRVAVMAWNTARHLELWYGVTGAGAVVHSVNPRLFDQQLVYIINHGGARMLFADGDLAPIVARIRPQLERIEQVVFLDAPETSVEGAAVYVDWRDAQGGADDAPWTPVDEQAAAGMCYTSGTTGDPKGVVYSHRSNVLHAMAMLQPDVIGISSNDVVCPIVPFFHAIGWSSPFSAPMAGAGMALPGRDLTPAAIYEVLEQGATITLAVPTVFLALLGWLDESGARLSTLKRAVIGGSACPRAVIDRFQDHYGVQVVHAWGMTETSSLGSAATPTPEIARADEETRRRAQETAGRCFYGVDLRVTTPDGDPVPQDGETSGHLQVRGFACSKAYHRRDGSALTDDGWFDTGDVGAMDANGFVRITDRSKDVIKSGGEWISSIDLENLAVAHPDVAEAAAVGVPHPKWGERPVVVVVGVGGKTPGRDGVLALYQGKVAKWQIPDDVIVVDEIPHTATGKISKLELRKKLDAMSYRLPEAG